MDKYLKLGCLKLNTISRPKHPQKVPGYHKVLLFQLIPASSNFTVFLKIKTRLFGEGMRQF